jgi:hypothetical protein
VEISRPDEKTILLAQINPVFAELLRQITSSADPTGSEAAQDRLFSPPIADLEEHQFQEDWQEYVEPELAKLFQSALQKIDADLGTLRVNAANGDATLTIPSEHLEAWIHGLNQARLVLTERHRLQEDDLDRPPPRSPDPRSFHLLQLHFYAELQLLFLRLLEGR